MENETASKLQQKEPERIFMNNIIGLRIKRGWTQEDVAAKIHVKRHRYAAWEEMRSFPALYYQKKLALLFQVPIDLLASVRGLKYDL